MIIGIDASRANILDKTGTEWYSYYLIQEFKKIAPRNLEFILYSKEKLKDGLNDLPINFKSKVLKWPPKFLWTQIRLSMEMLFHKPDILLVPSSAIPFIHPKKTVTTIHDIGFERFKQLYSNKEIGYKQGLSKKIIKILVKLFTFGKYSNTEYDYHRWSVRFALKHAEKIFTVSQFTKNEITNVFKVKGDNIKIISSSYDKSKYHTNQDFEKTKKILNKYNLTKPYLLFIGRLEEKKNIGGIIEAFGIFINKYLLKQYKLLLIGKPGLNFERAINIAKDYHIEKQIIMPGWIPDDEIHYLMGSAEIFIFPSFYEGFGIPVLEAMGCGIPVITSKIASLPEVGGDAAYYINPYNPEEIAKAIYKVLIDKNLNKILRIKGLERAKKFSWIKCAHESLDYLINNN